MGDDKRISTKMGDCCAIQILHDGKASIAFLGPGDTLTISGKQGKNSLQVDFPTRRRGGKKAK